MLIELRGKLAKNVTHLEHDALKNDDHTATELSDPHLDHLADRGSDNFARDLLIGMLQGSEAEICDIDAALAKMDSGSFGICENCDRPISGNRLKALPFARLCLRCKQTEERESAELGGP